MKKTLTLCLLLTAMWSSLYADVSPKREFRATWLATVQSIDWPYVKATSSGNILTQKKELTAYLDKLVAGNMNACCLQVRSLSDALYQSSYEPWAACLTGTRGQDPGYDPLAFAVAEAHKRGLELHIWVNPFRVTSSGNVKETDLVYKNCKQWLLKYDNGSFSGVIIDPGYPEARAYVNKVLMEIINNYDVDGIIMDDYFYPYGGTTTEDATSRSLYCPSGANVGDWRRSNVDKSIKMLYDSIQAVKPWVRFGMGPFGIWTTQSSVATKYGITLPSGINGLDDYAVQFCNTVEWVKGGYVDYIAPQLYWATTSSGQSYHRLCQWWGQTVCKHFSDMLPGNKRVDFFVSQAAYRFDAEEMGLEVDDNRKYDQLGGPGSVFYNTNSYLVQSQQSGDREMHLKLRQSHFTQYALPPAMDWKTAVTLPAPTNLQVNEGTLQWEGSCERYTVYAWPKGLDKDMAMESSQYLLGVTYSNSFALTDVSDLANTTLAVCPYDRFGNEYAPAMFNEGEQKPFYRIQVVSDDPDMGSVSGSGEFIEDSRAVIMAKPVYGYEFVRWNDGNTLNPRPITVKANATYTAYFRTIPAPSPETGTFSVTSLWSVSAATSGFMTTDNANRSIAYYAGEVYVSDGATHKYSILDAATGQLKQQVDLPNEYFQFHNLRFTEDGQLLFGNSGTNANYQSVYADVEDQVTLLKKMTHAEFGRTDYFYPYGSWEGSGYALMLSNNGGKLLYMPFAGGELLNESVVSHEDLPGGTSAKAVPADANTCFISVPGKSIRRYSVWTGEQVESWKRVSPTLNKTITGCGTFRTHGHVCLITPVETFGSFEVWDITNGMATPTQLVTATPALGSTENGAYTVDFATRVSGNNVDIFVLAPNNGVAAYRLTFASASTGITETAADGRLEVYDLQGRLLFSGTDTDREWFHSLQPGVYIIREGDNRYKICK